MYADLERKKCNGCKKTKSAKQYYTNSDGYLRSLCITCYSGPNKKYAKSKRGMAARKRAMAKFRSNPLKIKKDRQNKADWSREQKYGLKRGNFAKMLKRQDYKCAIQGCEIKHSKGRGLVVDHCHTNKKVRALLCDGCNRGLGSFRENVKALIGAAKYVRKFAKKFKK